MNEHSPPEAETKGDFRENLKRLGEAEGFYEDLGPEHSALFVERGRTLIVTFENLDHVYEFNADRMPWGYDFVTSQGWSLLGMMAHDWTWYRDEDVFDFFDRLRDQGFFEKFERVVFYGASMGAYAASVFSAASPGATVILISPQATLSREITPWETRYKKAWKRPFGGRYSYGPDMVRNASVVNIFYDPRAPLDAMHAALYRGYNVRKLRCRYMGHRIASLWLRMGVLKSVVLGCVNGDMEDADFYTHMRNRRENPRFQKEMLAILEKAERHKLLIRYCEAILARRRAPHFRSAMKRSRQALKGKG